MITVVDYGMGNIRSVSKAFEKIGFPILITNNKEEIKKAKAIVLPGVGAFKDCMENLRQLDLIETLVSHINSNKPFLGICLGLHLLFSESEEFGRHQGLDIFKGKVVKFNRQAGLKIPHMGWNQIKIKNNCPIMAGIKEEEYFYFVHSYYVIPEDKNIIALTTEYGENFVSGIASKNIFAVQFHPEKSQQAGLKILKNFGEVALC